MCWRSPAAHWPLSVLLGLFWVVRCPMLARAVPSLAVGAKKSIKNGQPCWWTAAWRRQMPSFYLMISGRFSGGVPTRPAPSSMLANRCLIAVPALIRPALRPLRTLFPPATLVSAGPPRSLFLFSPEKTRKEPDRAPGPFRYVVQKRRGRFGGLFCPVEPKWEQGGSAPPTNFGPRPASQGVSRRLTNVAGSPRTHLGRQAIGPRALMHSQTIYFFCRTPSATHYGRARQSARMPNHGLSSPCVRRAGRKMPARFS